MIPRSIAKLMFIVVISLGWEINFQRRMPLMRIHRRDNAANINDWMVKTIIFPVFQDVISRRSIDILFNRTFHQEEKFETRYLAGSRPLIRERI